MSFARSLPLFRIFFRRDGAPRTTLVARVAQTHATWRQRRQLEKLDARLLDDIGLSKTDAWSETRRPMWEQHSRHNR